MRTRRRELIGKIALVVGSVLLVLCALELTLRQWPTLLGYSFANGALSRYRSGAGGIHYVDRGLRMHFMIPNHRTTMFASGYVWHHETDALGFRNRPLHVPADVMLLGDSVVYGHGVEFEDTIGHDLEQRTGLRVANLGHQAYCAFQEAYLLTAYLPVFQPRVVVHVFSPNDIEDLYAFLSDAAMQAFIAKPLEEITYPPRTDPARLVAERERKIRERPLGRRLEEELYVMKMFRWIGSRYREWRPSASIAEAAPRGRRFDVPNPSTDPASLGWRYTEHALAYMKYRAEPAGARLLEAPLVEGRPLSILRDIAARHAIDLVDPAPLFAGPSFLPNDGHLSPHGARVLADLIAAHIDRLPRTVTHVR
jgi:hypothetical protein